MHHFGKFSNFQQSGRSGLKTFLPPPPPREIPEIASNEDWNYRNTTRRMSRSSRNGFPFHPELLFTQLASTPRRRRRRRRLISPFQKWKKFGFAPSYVKRGEKTAIMVAQRRRRRRRGRCDDSIGWGKETPDLNGWFLVGARGGQQDPTFEGFAA